MKVSLARISVLEKRRDISYRSIFYLLNRIEYIIRGCGSDLYKREYAIY